MYIAERQNYIKHLLAFQGRMGLSNAKMAEILEINERTYKRFIAGHPIHSEFDLIMRVYELSGKMMFVMTGAKVPREVENSELYLQLDETYRNIADKLMRALYEEQMNAKKKERN